jgi:Papain family cysteine protease
MTSVDWRNRFGMNWISSVRSQGGTSNYWAFATTALYEAMVRIEQCVWCRRSEADLVRGVGKQPWDLGNLGEATAFVQNHGLADPACFLWTEAATKYTAREGLDSIPIRRLPTGLAEQYGCRSLSPPAIPRSRRRTTSVFCRAENRWGLCQPFLLPSPVALRASCEGTSMDNSGGCIWTPPMNDYTQIGVQSNCTPNHRFTEIDKLRDAVVGVQCSINLERRSKCRTI